uniref:TIL domain-containing protein n=1 Tax=Anopheles quadriannulatus TaxID=34691 RepID=A0A904A3R5_ANOQN
MKVVVVLCFCLLAFGLLMTVGAADVCRFGERWRCGSAACEKKCDTLTSTTECTEPCTDGCYCEPGFVRVAVGTCSPQFVCRYKNGSPRRLYA